MSSEGPETVYEALCAKLLKSSKQRESCISLRTLWNYYIMLWNSLPRDSCTD